MINLIKEPYPLVMGIINMSPDSFYGGNCCTNEEQFEAMAHRFLEEGATILDVGACSTRPGAQEISIEKEWELLKPALKKILRAVPHATISLDTTKAEIVERTYDFIGDFIINDISAGEGDPQMLSTAARLELPYIAMHMRGTPQNMQNLCNYDDVVTEVANYLRDFVNRAYEIGVKEIIVDPGFGFAKNLNQNYAMLANLEKFKIETPEGNNCPILVGLSRKSMIYRHLGITANEALSATSALHMAALINGAQIIRVHDVKEAAQIIKLYKLLLQNR